MNQILALDKKYDGERITIIGKRNSKYFGSSNIEVEKYLLNSK